MKKSLLSEAKAALIDMMKLDGEISVDDAVAELDLAKTTIRQHLQLLEQYGLVKRRQQRQGRGRPRIMYSLTEQASEFYPDLDAELLRDIIEYLIQQGHLDLVDDFFRERWLRSKKKVLSQAQAAGDTFEVRMKALSAFLSEQGFLPESDLGVNSLSVCNCPYRSVVDATRLPCRLERELIEELSGQQVERVEYIIDGDARCVYKFAGEVSAGT
jgi:predicted ArsR family transcriptional regulator